MRRSHLLRIIVGCAITLTNTMVAAYTVGPELIPDPEFNDPTKWDTTTGFGGNVTDSHLVFINATVIRAAPLPDVLAEISQQYQYSIVVDEYTFGFARILFGGVDLWTQDDGVGTFINTFTATDATGLVAQALPATYKINSISIKAVTAVPLPATLWLFSSGLLGLIGISRHKKA
jgi:hypothetical protein